MSEHTILPAEHALMMAQCLNNAVDRMPGLSIEGKKILAAAAYLMAEHTIDALSAADQVAQSLEKFYTPLPES